MRIAIVDDITSERKELHKRLSAQLKYYTLREQILEYENGETFLSDVKKEHFAFMDIYMDGENGVEIAKKLRSFDTNCLLVFITTLLKAFGSELCIILSSPIRMKNLKICLMRLLNAYLHPANIWISIL